MHRLPFLLLFALLAAPAGCQEEDNSTEWNPPFPRLAMWWPDTGKPELYERVASYDWIAVSAPQVPTVEANIRPLNPNLKVAVSINLTETEAFTDWNEPDPGPRGLPAEYFLTQPGSLLAEDLDSAQTTIRVESVRTGETPLFETGDYLVAGTETMRVLGVNEQQKTLEVQRGIFRLAAPHQSGTRIAAAISFWPESFVMNVSEACPRIVMDEEAGAENWIEYATRMTNLPEGIDAIQIDRADANQSWLVQSGFARGIDPDASNVLLDEYTGFDESWNAGMAGMLSAMESRHPGLPVFLNNGIRAFAQVNGSILEDPLADSSRSWHDAVFGSPSNTGSYSEWTTLSPTPNFTLWETYEDRRSFDDIEFYEYDNPARRPGFEPNYRRMRFELCTALLLDGFFSYEVSTYVHGGEWLFWFDEYDNAGEGRGYLGYPKGKAYRVLPPFDTENLFAGGTFDSADDLEEWNLWTDTGYEASVDTDSNLLAEGDAAARLEIARALGTHWKAAFSFSPVPLGANTDYTVSFWARSEPPRILSMWLQEDEDPWRTWAHFGTQRLTSEWRRYELPAISTGADAEAVFNVGLGQETGTVWIDAISLVQGNRSVWRRDFDNGTVLVNSTAVEQKIELGAKFRRITGTQVPHVNDGSVAESVRLPSRDGLILLGPVESSAQSSLWIGK